ncbi:hypothetical protein QTP88_020910 [Uroleucon formosanum]
MSSKKQTQYGEGTSGMKKSAQKGKKSNQPLSNDECCNTNAELDAPKEELISRQNKPSHSLWYIVKLFVIQANKEDLIWLHNLIKGFEVNYDCDVYDISVYLNKENEDEYLAKNMLFMKLNNMHYCGRNRVVLSPALRKCLKGSVIKDTDGKKLIISRETVKLNVTKNYAKPATERQTKSKKISHEFIARLIKWDDTLSHLRGISPKQIDDYVNKCQEEGCLEKIEIETERMDKKILSYKKRGRYTLRNQRKTALIYREFKDIRFMLEKYNYFVLERHFPYFMFH